MEAAVDLKLFEGAKEQSFHQLNILPVGTSTIPLQDRSASLKTQNEAFQFWECELCP